METRSMDNSTGMVPPGEHEQPGQPYQPYVGQAQSSAVTSTVQTSAYGNEAPGPTGSQAGISSRQRVLAIGIGLLSLFLIAAAFVVKGEPERFVTVGLQFVPLAILAALAYGALRSTTAAVFTYVWLVILMLLVLLNSFASVLIVVANIDVIMGQQTSGVRPTLDEIFKPGAGEALLWTTLLLMLSVVVSLAMLLRPVRVLMSKIMPVDPDNFVHKIGLSILTLILFTSFVPLIALGGRPPILELINSRALDNIGAEASIGVRPVDLIYQFVWTIPATLVAAGWPIVRKFPAVLVRLGMVRPSLRQVLFGVGAGVALAAFALFGLDPGVNSLWKSLGWEPTDVQAFEKLLSQLVTPLGAVLIGVTAGVGEEMAVRGLLQPRIGLIASNLVFTAFHAFQYGVDALLSVFIVGLVLGVIRAKSNTTTSAIVHGVYDFVLIMTSVIINGQ
jgi:membrane protease YdiL (CAAX protease family)